METKNPILEQAKLFEGKDHWHSNGKPSVTFSDGPNGLRIEDAKGIGFVHSKEATVFPTAVSVACSFDRDLLKEYGEVLAEECISEKVDVILGPGVNTKRSPLCGRNFEYFSEDPVVSGECAAAYIQGVQSKGIGTSLKHFAGNSRELARQVQDSIIDERALQELYLKQFKITIRKSHPWTLMAAYNRLNGVFCCENAELFREAKSWGFDGIFISDWGGVSDPLKSIESGLNLEMPGPTGSADVIAKAVKEGKLSAACVEESAHHFEDFQKRCGKYKAQSFDQKEHDAFCEKAAEESIVLMKNQNILPLKKTETIAVIGPYAEHPCIQGSGSSKVNARKQDHFLKALKEAAISYTYAKGYSLETDAVDDALAGEAMDAAKDAAKIIVFAGEQQSGGEGFDRASMDLPMNQNAIIRDLAHTYGKVIVVLQTGAPVAMPWRSLVDGIVCEYEAGAKSGIALKKVLYGDVNPAGHLAETWPLRNEDVPCARYYERDVMQTQYRESIYVGYRYYDTFQVPVAYPFGYGLSYTAFAYQNLKITTENFGIRVSFEVTNTGEMDGRTVAQVYVGMKDSRIARAAKELKGFDSIFLHAKETKEVQIDIDAAAFAYFDVKRNAWEVEKGKYQIFVGTSCEEIILQGEMERDGIEDPYATMQKDYIQYDEGMVYVNDEDYAKILGHAIPEGSPILPFTPDTTVRDLKAKGLGKFINFAIKKIITGKSLRGVDDASVYNAPIRQMLWLKEHFTWNTVYAVTDYLNHHGLKEWHRMIAQIRKELHEN